jgi:hypothetical protein
MLIPPGMLKFEVRGLNNQITKRDYGTRQYKHTAMVVAVGDPQYTKGAYILLCSVKRVSGGDPEYPREDDDSAEVIIRDGIGRLHIYGATAQAPKNGNRKKSKYNRWRFFQASR